VRPAAVPARLRQLLLATLAFSFALSAAAQQRLAPIPPTPRKPVTNTYHGTTVTDDYRWLENNDDPAVRAWSQAESSRTRAFLDSIPARAAIADWFKQLMRQSSVSYYELQTGGDLLFAMKSQPGVQQDVLVSMKSPGDPASARVVVDPNAIDAKGTTSIQFYAPSLDGRLVAVCLARGGSESGGVRVYETATGRALPDEVSRVNFPTAGESVAWSADGTGFYYTRYPHQGERPAADLNFYQQVYFHKLGTPDSADTYVIGKDFPRIAEVSLTASRDGRYLLALVENGDGGDYEHVLRDPEGRWTQLTHFGDQAGAADFSPDGGSLYVVSHKDAPRGKIVRVPTAAPDLSKAVVIVPESEVVIQGFRFALSGFPADFVVTRDRLYVVDIVGGPNQVRVFDLSGKPLGTIPIEPVSAVEQVIGLRDGEVLFRNASYVRPPAWYRYDAASNRAVPTALASTSPVRFDDIAVSRETAVSKDGTKVPLTVLRKKGLALDGSHPAILTGYGGFGLSQSPQFNPSLAPWLASGGVFAIANLRGGGEFGEAWHEAGMLTNKQHVFDDFIACSEHLVEAGYTRPERLGIEGGSNGGLLMGAVLTQRPDLYRAVVSVAGLYDMLRFETTQNGQFNRTEYGSVTDPAQFKALLAYSPYQHVRAGTRYPAVLLTVGENDLRVDPWHSRKFAAALQAAGPSKGPILFLSYGNAGHGGIGAGEDLAVTMMADEWSFLFDQLGVRFAPPPLEKATAH
jgi:prolyl oligopeptidase